MRIVLFMWNIFRSCRLRYRIIRIYTVITILAILMIGMFTYIYMTNATNSVINNYSNIVIDQVSANIEQNIVSLESIINSVYYYDFLLDILVPKEELSDYEELIASKRIQEILRSLLSMRKDIEKVAIYSLETDIKYELAKSIREGEHIYLENGVENEPWYARVMSKERLLNAEASTLELDTTKLCFSAYKIINGEDLSTPKGIICVDVNIDPLRRLCNEVKTANNGRVIIFDELGHAVHDSDAGAAQALSVTAADLRGQDKIMLGASEYLIRRHEIQRIGWQIVYMVSSDEIFRYQNTIRNMTILVGFFIVVLMLVVSIRFASALTSPIESLTKHIRQVACGNFSPYLNSYKYRDEINDLIVGLNAMVFQINNLIKSEYEAKLLTKEAQFNSLMSQINPHFLCNVLENISGLGYAHNVPKLVAIAEHLSELLRYSIDNDNPLSTLEEELFSVEKYVAIQNLRFKDKIKLIVSADEDAKACMILKFTLQPLVENAVIHGLSPKSYNGSIVICAEKTGQRLSITVLDDGVGISAELLEELNCGESLRKKTESDKNHIGIQNVKSRLRIYFGEHGGVRFESRVGAFTRIYVDLPAIKPDREGENNA